jgi:hypothetical protein
VLLVRTTNVGRDEGSGGSTSEQDGEDASGEALGDTRVDADDNRCEDEDDCQAEEGVHYMLLNLCGLGCSLAVGSSMARSIAARNT